LEYPRYLSWRLPGQFYLVSQFSFKESFEGKENRLKTALYALTEDGQPLAYVQARDSGSRFLNRWMPPAVESWSKCDQCQECEDKCPYHLPVRQIISENIDFYKKVASEIL
jgi:ferredoxin